MWRLFWIHPHLPLLSGNQTLYIFGKPLKISKWVSNLAELLGQKIYIKTHTSEIGVWGVTKKGQEIIQGIVCKKGSPLFFLICERCIFAFIVPIFWFNLAGLLIVRKRFRNCGLPHPRPLQRCTKGYKNKHHLL